MTLAFPGAGAVPAPILRYERLPLLVRAALNELNLGRGFAAEQILHDVLDDDPGVAMAYALLGTVHERRGEVRQALEMHRRACALEPDNPTLWSAMIFGLDQSGDATLADAYAARRRVNDLIRVVETAPHDNDRTPDRRLRVGYVSADFKNHSAAFGWAPVVLLADPDALDVYAYSGAPGDEITADFQAAVPNWRDTVGMDDDALDALIRADKIDVLVDLSGHSAGNRLAVFARKPAPVQVTGWGYITGTGLDAMDYLFADDVAIRPDEERYYAEEVVRLPRILTFWAADERGVGPVAPAPHEANGHLTFGVFNRIGKIQTPCVVAWTKILTALPDARLVVKAPGLDDEPARLALEQKFRSAGCDLSRLEFRGITPKIEHLHAYSLIDVNLDPSPHGGGMSTLEACWQGVPTLTLPARQIPSRIATTINEELGLSYLIASDWDDYVARAVALDGQRDRVSRVRRALRQTMRVSWFGDHGTYAKTVEQKYRWMWERWCRGEMPEAATPAELEAVS